MMKISIAFSPLNQTVNDLIHIVPDLKHPILTFCLTIFLNQN